MEQISFGELVERLKELDMHSVAITDHGNMFGVIELYKKCKEHGIKLIVGCEVYVSTRSRFEKDVNSYSSKHMNHKFFLYNISFCGV